MEERAEVLAQLEGRETAISAGGSLSNTLLSLARLSAAGAARWGGAPLRVGMAGLVGSDPLGGFFSAQVAPGGTCGLRLVWAVEYLRAGVLLAGSCRCAPTLHRPPRHRCCRCARRAWRLCHRRLQAQRLARWWC